MSRAISFASHRQIVSSGMRAANVAQIQERAVCDCGTGDDLIPDAQAQCVFIVNELEDDLADSGYHHARSQHCDGWVRCSSRA